MQKIQDSIDYIDWKQGRMTQNGVCHKYPSLQIFIHHL